MTEQARLVLDAASRPLRRLLRPIEWVVLEDVALDVHAERGTLVAATSARAVAEHLGITPQAAAKALARLRSEGLVRLSRRPGPAGRFGLSVYELASVDGLAVVGAQDEAAPEPERPPPAAPRPAAPRAVTPSPARPRRAKRHAADDDEQPASSSSRRPVAQLDLLRMDLPIKDSR